MYLLDVGRFLGKSAKSVKLISFRYFKSILRFFFTFDFAFIIIVYNDYSVCSFPCFLKKN